MSQEAAIQAWLPALEKQLREKGADVRETFLFLRVTRARLHEWIVRFDVNEGGSVNHTGPTAIEALQTAQQWVNNWKKSEPEEDVLIKDELVSPIQWNRIFNKFPRTLRSKPNPTTAWYNQPNQGGKAMKPRK